MVDKDAIRRSYDELADVYAEQRTENGRGTEILRQFLDGLPVRVRVLDAGCGQGTPALSRLDAETTAVGVDLSREQLGLAASNLPECRLVQGDMTMLPFDAATFDAIVAYWSLIHVPMDDHRTVLDEFARVLEPGGRMLVCEGTAEWSGENPDWLDSGVNMEWNIAGAKTTRNQLERVGFTIVDRWGTPSELEADRESEADDDTPWTFFSARLAPP